MSTQEFHQSQLQPSANKFHSGNGADGKHYWITPRDLYAELDAQYSFDFDPCPHPLPEGFDGLTCEWGLSNYVNPPFGSIIHQGRKKGPTAWARKAIAEAAKGKSVVMVYPIDKWVLMLLAAGAEVRNLGDVRWLSTEDGSAGKGTGRHIAAFILLSGETRRVMSVQPDKPKIVELIPRHSETEPMVTVTTRDYSKRQCDHASFKVDTHDRKVKCGLCDLELDAMHVLVLIAESEARRRWFKESAENHTRKECEKTIKAAIVALGKRNIDPEKYAELYEKYVVRSGETRRV